jgi:hypothetical protein
MRRALSFSPLLSVLVLLCVSATGCTQATPDPRPSCTPDEALADNSLVATVGGANWEATSTGYQLPPTGLLASFAVDSTNYMSLRLVTETIFDLSDDGVISELEGADIADIIEGSALPSDFALGDSADEGADATIAVDGDTLHSGNADGGFLRLTSLSDGVLRGCFFFEADAQPGGPGDRVLVESGSFALTAL